MATLKSIKNKYLTSTDGDALGVTTNTENISTLSFKLATADSLTKFNLVDGMSDDYNDATGVDAAASTNDARSSDNYYYGETSVAYKVHKFTSSGTFTTDTAETVEYLVVGGGGGGGGNDSGTRGGGGGGGGVRSGSLSIAAASFSITVGSAGQGVGGPGSTGTQGGSSIFSTITSAGGGGGGNAANTGGTGGSGGGGGGTSAAGGAGNTPSTSPVQGYAGGPGGDSGTGVGGGGGGGAGEVGTTGTTGAGGPGGDGVQSDILINGTNVYYGGGGGGYGHSDGGGSGGTGGLGGGGKSNTPSRTDAAVAGTDGLGGGGGAGGHYNQYGRNGGTGLVVIRRPDVGTSTGGTITTDTVTAAGGNMTLQSNVFTAQTAPTTARIILDEETVAGTTTLNTDLKAYASRDNGTTFTQMTLASQGNISYNAGIDSYTKLMMHCDGANSGTVFTDSSLTPHTITSTNTITSTTTPKFGTASAYFDGSGDYMSIPYSTDFDFGSGDITIDFWFRTPQVPNSGSAVPGNNTPIWGYCEYTGGRWKGWGFGGREKTNGVVTMMSLGMISDLTGAYAEPDDEITIPIDNSWHHYAYVRQGNVAKIYKDGVLGSTYTGTAGNINASDLDTTSTLRFGIFEYTDTYWGELKGNLDEIRISKGIARWTAPFTPPAVPYSNDRRLLSGSVDISGQPAGSNMKYKIETLNQASSKQTRIYGTSMAWA